MSLNSDGKWHQKLFLEPQRAPELSKQLRIPAPCKTRLLTRLPEEVWFPAHASQRLLASLFHFPFRGEKGSGPTGEGKDRSPRRAAPGLLLETRAAGLGSRPAQSRKETGGDRAEEYQKAETLGRFGIAAAPPPPAPPPHIILNGLAGEASTPHGVPFGCHPDFYLVL